MDCNDGGCLTAAVMFGVPGIRVLAAGEVGGELHLLVETVEQVGGCHCCGVVAVAHRRREHLLRDAPFGHRPVVVMWRKRIFRCAEAACPVETFSEEHPLAGERAALTARAITWAADALECDDTTVSALARRLGVGWHTVWRAVKVEATRRADRPGRLDGVATLGVDEHVWRPGRYGAGREVTVMVDLTRGRDGRLRSRLLDIVPGRSGTAYKAWLDAQTPAFRGGVKHAALDPFRGYANALRDSLCDAVAVLDAFHVVKLGTQVVDEVRRRVQQQTLHRRGHRDDPLYTIRGLLRHGAEHLSPRQIIRLDTGLAAGDPSWEVTVTWQCYQQLRSIYHAGHPDQGRRRAERVIATLHTCPIPEVARLGRTLRAWRHEILAYFHTRGVSNGGTEAINGVIEKTRRLAHGFRNFDNYRLRLLLAANGARPYPRRAQPVTP
jgi:transposase